MKTLIIGAGLCGLLLSPLAQAGRGHVDIQIGVGGVGLTLPGVVVTPVQPYYYNHFPTSSRGIPPAQYYYYYEQRPVPVDPCANATYIDGQYNPPAAQAYCRGAYERGIYGR